MIRDYILPACYRKFRKLTNSIRNQLIDAKENNYSYYFSSLDPSNPTNFSRAKLKLLKKTINPELKNLRKLRIQKNKIPARDIFSDFNGYTLPDSSRHKKMTDTRFTYEAKIQKDEYNFDVYGCHGAATKWMSGSWDIKNEIKNQAAVAAQINIFEYKDFNIGCGDNSYEYGIPSDTLGKAVGAFNKIHYKKYKYVPAFYALGNHDYTFVGGFEKFYFRQFWRNPRDESKALESAFMQVLQSYYPGNDQQPNPWLMPNRYYYVDLGFADYFFIDSNTYAFDKRQQNWLRRMMLMCEQRDNEHKQTRWKVLICHHPLISYGKRGVKFGASQDTESYFIRDSEFKGKKYDVSMNTLLRRTLAANDCFFHIQFCAHDHFLSSSVVDAGGGHHTLQIVAGGGGGKLQLPRVGYHFKEVYPKHSGLYKQHGFARCHITPNKFSMTFINRAGEKLYNIQVKKSVKMTASVEVESSSASQASYLVDTKKAKHVFKPANGSY